MVVLLIYGVGISLWSDAGLWQDLVAVRPALRLSPPTWPTISTPEAVRAVFLLVLPQAALTVGNAVLATAVICSPIELDTDGAILLRRDWGASWASFHGSRTADASSPWSSSGASSSRC